MAERIPARLTRSQGRKFAFPVGGAFLVFAAISWWRGHELPPVILGALGGVLIVAGVLVPRSLGPVQRSWMAMAHAISKITTPIFLSLVYFLVFTPIGLLKRTFRRNAVKHTARDGSYWVAIPSGGRSNLERQF